MSAFEVQAYALSSLVDCCAPTIRTKGKELEALSVRMQVMFLTTKAGRRIHSVYNARNIDGCVVELKVE